MSARSALAAGALVAVSFTGLAIAVGGSATAATPHTSSAVGVVSAAATTTTDTAAPKLGWRWWAGLSSDQQQCLAKAGLTRPAFPLTDAEKAAVQTAVRDAAQGCGITLPTGERAAALRTWWEGLTDAQRTCLKDADVTRPLGPLTAAERKAVREKVTAAATSCHATLPTLPTSGAKASGGSGS